MQQRLHRFAIAVDHVEHPGGSPASAASRAIYSAAEGTRSEGFSTKVLPHATAIGHIHSGTIAGKLNGVMPATTPSG